ncbi:metallophosphoesterase [Chitinophaga caseinilytica]|uniref:Metallophosphoesterase n=1 Tax=Chitinophaga caseinilytica TaxID=2267521 RepID=A0ABZ2ZBL4_9BACT
MRAGPNLLSTILLVIIMLALDAYVFYALRSLMANAAPRLRGVVFTLYWVLSAVVMASIVFYGKIPWAKFMQARAYYLTFAFSFSFSKLMVALFLFIDDGRRAVMWVVEKVRSAPAVAAAVQAREEGNRETEGMSRSRFLLKSGFLVGGTLMGTLLYGLSNKYNYHVRKLRLAYPNLPSAFKGLKIVQISDIHSGSFNDKEAVKRGVELIQAQKPDLVLFTGDLVNDRSLEMDDYLDVFDKINAPMGVFSTLGNHDYGDYYPWPDYDNNRRSRLKAQNLETLKGIHAKMGWRLLMNENKILEKDGQQIALLGVENWSMNPRFPRLGDMKAAYEGTREVPFKILLSHDPTHWDGQIRTEYPDIDLMLAGHTHGMQFGVEIPFFKWSPAQYIYRQWAGLYEEGKQRLYVNRGFGFLGYPGRVGILPEITVIELV